MNIQNGVSTTQSELPVGFVEALLALHAVFDRKVASALAASLANEQHPMLLATGSNNAKSPLPDAKVGKYIGMYCGQNFSADTLSQVFGKIVDFTAEVAPEALEILETKPAKTRRFVSRERNGVHLSSPHLPVARTHSGWWISSNVSDNQTQLAVRNLCKVAGLSFGRDVWFRRG